MSLMTRLDVAGGTVAAAAGLVPVAAAAAPGALGWVLLLTMSAADSTQFWQFWTYSRVRWYVSEPIVDWVVVVPLAVAGATGAGAIGATTGSPNPVGVEGSGGVCRLLSMGFGGGCGWGWRGLAAAARLATTGDICDWLMSPHWISTSTGFADGAVELKLTLKGFLYCWGLLGPAAALPEGWLMWSEPCISMARQQW